jgi:hypothetical protein
VQHCSWRFLVVRIPWFVKMFRDYNSVHLVYKDLSRPCGFVSSDEIVSFAVLWYMCTKKIIPLYHVNLAIGSEKKKSSARLRKRLLEGSDSLLPHYRLSCLSFFEPFISVWELQCWFDLVHWTWLQWGKALFVWFSESIPERLGRCFYCLPAVPCSFALAEHLHACRLSSSSKFIFAFINLTLGYLE